VTSLSNGAGGINNTYTYDTFGNSSGSTGGLSNPFQYTGREFDSETRIYLYRARYYDSSTGRFLSEDPIAFVGGTNFYAYVNDAPTRLIDPSGLLGIEPATQQQIDALQGLFPNSRNAGGTIIVFMPCSEVQKILEQNGYSTANNTPTSWYNSWLFNSPAHQGTEVHRPGGFHFVLRDSTEKCPDKTCTITDMHNDPHDPLDQPVRHIMLDSFPWGRGTHYSTKLPPPL